MFWIIRCEIISIYVDTFKIKIHNYMIWHILSFYSFDKNHSEFMILTVCEPFSSRKSSSNLLSVWNSLNITYYHIPCNSGYPLFWNFTFAFEYYLHKFGKDGLSSKMHFHLQVVDHVLIEFFIIWLHFNGPA
jgi:hypothetical protein